MFVNELKLYVDYYWKEREIYFLNPTPKKLKYLQKFAEQVLVGIDYYKVLLGYLSNESEEYRREMGIQLAASEEQVNEYVGEFA